MLVDGIDFYSRLVSVKGGKFEMSFKLDTSDKSGVANAAQVAEVKGVFFDEDDAREFMNAILHERVKEYG